MAYGFDTVVQISSSDILKHVLPLLAVFVLVFICMPSFFACAVSNQPVIVPTPAHNTEAPPETSAPTDESEKPIVSFISHRDEYHAAIGEFLQNGTISKAYTVSVFSPSLTGEQVFFDYSGDEFCVFLREELYSGRSALCSEPIAYFTRSAGEAAQSSLTAYYYQYGWGEYTVPTGKSIYPRRGYSGDGFAVIVGDSVNSNQLCCIFTIDENGEWHEFGETNGVFPSIVTGACIRNEHNGFICFMNYAYEGYEEERNRIFVFFSGDGGGSWRDLGLCLPEEYASFTCYPLSPVFKGDHGVIPVYCTGSSLNPDEQYVLCFFETYDNGVSWRFNSDAVFSLEID
ncbi:MAG: hypothetical protein J5544_05925 [Clostridia bacterium]|nr:hypothetical protein [Clostridia bacterium]